MLIFMYGMKQYNFCLCFQTNISVFRDNNFEIPITPFDFHQIQLPGTVLNAELQGLFKTVIGIKIWPSIDREITLSIECIIALPRQFHSTISGCYLVVVQ